MSDEKAEYTEHDINVLTKLTTLENDVSYIKSKIDNLHAGVMQQWNKIDRHGEQIAALNAKAGMWGTVGGAVMATALGLFSKFVGK